MPLYESMSATVTLIVEVDGHWLTFEETANRVAGARYHGADPRKTGYATSDTLESSIRDRVDECIDKAAGRAQESLKRLYPVHTDREDSK
jgi:hypothetical protein